MLIPRFLITNKTLKNIASIEAVSEVFEQIPLVPVWELKLREEAVVKQIYFGLRAIGSKLSVSEVEKIVKEEPLRSETPKLIMERTGITSNENHVREVMNYRNALKIVEQWIVMQQKKGGDIIYNKDQLLQVQVLMMEKLVDSSEIGSWRSSSLPTKSFGQEVFKPANAIEIPYQIDDLFSWLNNKETKSLHPVLKAAVVDYELTRIQAFSSGSDRIASLYSYFILSAEGINKRRLVSFEEQRFVDTDQHRLVAESERMGMLTTYIEWWSGIVCEAMVKTKEKVKRLAVDTQIRNKIGQQVSLNERQIRLVEFLGLKEWAVILDIRRILADVSDDTILRDLKDLIKKGLVKKKGKTKGAKYALKSSVK